ncbi:MAG: cell division protein FtsZ, partial [Alphaproteobacteria bacterium]|nr:cell division protein FtsZ [Alphaproteobacteria bacterium]
YALQQAASARAAAAAQAAPAAEAEATEPVSYAEPPRPAPAPRPAPRAPVAASSQPAAPPPPRRSIFNLMTGAIRGYDPAATAPRVEPARSGEPRQEPVRADVRQTGGEEMQIDIPAFLRRQSS